MDVDNPHAREDLQSLIGTWNIPKIKADDLIPDSFSWTWSEAKWYVNKYYEDNLEKYVDTAKQWLSWTVQELRWYYNSWVEELNRMVNDKVSWTISGELNKFKLK